MRSVLIVIAATLSGCAVYQQPPLVVEEHQAPSAYWTVVQEQNRADLERRAAWETEEELRQQQWTDAEIRHEQINDLARYTQAVRR